KVLDWTFYAGTLLPSKEPDDLYFLGLGAPFDGQSELNYHDKDFSLSYTRWETPEWNNLFAELKRTVDEKKRQDLMNQLQTILWKEPPWLYIYNEVNFSGGSQRLEGEAGADERI